MGKKVVFKLIPAPNPVVLKCGPEAKLAVLLI
jgi:hypothetical protein